ncbi:MAG: hypothetical protein ACLFTV_17570, partial [Desulfococcaceae bacterium]
MIPRQSLAVKGWIAPGLPRHDDQSVIPLKFHVKTSRQWPVIKKIAIAEHFGGKETFFSLNFYYRCFRALWTSGKETVAGAI